MTRGYTRVINNPKGGTYYVTLNDDIVMLHVTQKLSGIIKGKLVIETRKAEIFGPLDRMLKFKIGDFLSGHIYVKESVTPVDYDDHELYLSINEDGTYEKIGDNYVWRYTLYSEDPEETDQLVTNRFVATT